MEMRQEGHIALISQMCQLIGARKYLELGIYQGDCLLAVADANPQCVCIGVDSVHHPIPYRPNVAVYFESTEEYFEKLAVEKPLTKFDVIFIDADHSYDAVKADLFKALQAVRPKGLIFLHDTHPAGKEWTSKGFCGDAYRIVRELQAEPAIQAITLPYHPGLTIVQHTYDEEFPWQ